VMNEQRFWELVSALRPDLRATPFLDDAERRSFGSELSSKLGALGDPPRDEFVRRGVKHVIGSRPKTDDYRLFLCCAVIEAGKEIYDECLSDPSRLIADWDLSGADWLAEFAGPGNHSGGEPYTEPTAGLPWLRADITGPGTRIIREIPLAIAVSRLADDHGFRGLLESAGVTDVRVFVHFNRDATAASRLTASRRKGAFLELDVEGSSKGFPAGRDVKAYVATLRSSILAATPGS
jgi:hypothetical protein